MAYRTISELPTKWRKMGAHGAKTRTWMLCLGAGANDAQAFLAEAAGCQEALGRLGLTVEAYDPDQIRQRGGGNASRNMRTVEAATVHTAQLATAAAQEVAGTKGDNMANFMGADGAAMVARFATEYLAQFKGKGKE